VKGFPPDKTFQGFHAQSDGVLSLICLFRILFKVFWKNYRIYRENLSMEIISFCKTYIFRISENAEKIFQ
jgi:hypothetical protein